METFFPSEIARLVLGYLKEEKCLTSWHAFLEESSNLEEYFNLYKKGKVYSTNVNGNSLLDILNEYCILKFEAVSNGDKIESSSNAYRFSQSEFLKTIRKDIFVETTRNAVDLVFQKHLSSICCNRNKSPSDVSVKVSSSKSSDNKQNKLTSVMNEVNNKHKVCNQGTIQNVNSSESNVELNITEKDNDHASDQLNVSEILGNTLCHPSDLSNFKLTHLHGTAKADKDLRSSSVVTNVKSVDNAETFDSITGQINSNDSLINLSASVGCNRNLHSMNSKSVVVVENPSITNSKVTDKKIVVTSKKSTLVDNDVELEIITEVKKGDINNGIQSDTNENYQNIHTSNNSHSSNNYPVINMQASNSNDVVAMNTSVCNVWNKITECSNSKQKVNSSKSNPVINVQPDNNKDLRINQTALYNVQNKVNQFNNSEHEENSLNAQTKSNCNSQILYQPAAINSTPFTISPRYILPNYSSNSSFINNNNNAQFYFVLNTPESSNSPTVSGTFLSVPFQTNNVPNPQNNVSNPMLTVAVKPAVSEISLAAPKAVSENTLIVSRPKNMTDTLSVDGKSLAPRVSTRISYAGFTEPEVSNSSNFYKRKKNPQKGSLGRKTNKKKCLLVADQPGQDQKASMNKKQNTNEEYFLPVRQPLGVQKSSKKKKTVRKNLCKNKKVKTGDQSFAFKTLPGSTNHSAILNENRVLKVVLSDMFLEPSPEHNPSLKQCVESTDLVEHNKDCKDQRRDSEKLAGQNRRSPRIQSKENTKHSSEPKNINTMSLQKEKKVTKCTDPSLLTNNRKIDPSNKRSVNRNSLTFDMTTAVLNSMEEARQRVIGVKKHSMFDTELSLQNSSAKTLEPRGKSTLQSIIHDVCKNTKCDELERYGKVITDGEKMIKLATASGSILSNSLHVVKNFSLSSSDDRRENEESFESIVSKEVTAEYENTTIDSGNFEKCSNMSQGVLNSQKIKLEQKQEITDNYKNTILVLGDSNFEKCRDLSQKFLEQNNETKEVISLQISNKDSSDVTNADKQVIVNDCIIEEKQRSSNFLSSIRCVNVDSNIKTSISRKLKYGEKCLNTRPLINHSVCNEKNNIDDKEDSRNPSDCEIFKSGSESFNAVNTKEDNSNFIFQTSETSVFSVSTSVSANAKIFSIAGESHTEAKSHSEIMVTSCTRGKNILTELSDLNQSDLKS